MCVYWKVWSLVSLLLLVGFFSVLFCFRYFGDVVVVETSLKDIFHWSYKTFSVGEKENYVYLSVNTDIDGKKSVLSLGCLVKELFCQIEKNLSWLISHTDQVSWFRIYFAVTLLQQVYVEVFVSLCFCRYYSKHYFYFSGDFILTLSE